jgi:hypothetical protein
MCLVDRCLFECGEAISWHEISKYVIQRWIGLAKICLPMRRTFLLDRDATVDWRLIYVIHAVIVTV